MKQRVSKTGHVAVQDSDLWRRESTWGEPQIAQLCVERFQPQGREWKPRVGRKVLLSWRRQEAEVQFLKQSPVVQRTISREDCKGPSESEAERWSVHACDKGTWSQGEPSLGQHSPHQAVFPQAWAQPLLPQYPCHTD